MTVTPALTPSVPRDPWGRSAVRNAPRVLVVDDHPTFAELLAGALQAAGMAVLGMAHSAARAVAMAEDLQPDVVVMDMQMPRHDGLSATRRVREVAPLAVVAAVSDHRDPEWVVRATQAGACAFIPKDCPLAEMLDVLARVRAGSMLIAPTTFSTAPTDGIRPAPVEGAHTPLTRREREVLECLGSGMQIKAIARVLGITLETCRGYVKSLNAKLGARSQLEAVVKAQQLGLLCAAA
jgi:DNA-binding NarL/FixJ family response regulator